MLQRSREAALAVPTSTSKSKPSTTAKLLDPERNNDAIAVNKASARWSQLTTALDLQPAPCKNLSKLLLKGNAFSTAGVAQLMDALETNRTGAWRQLHHWSFASAQHPHRQCVCLCTRMRPPMCPPLCSM